MLLRLSISVADWVRIVAALEAAELTILAGVVRTLLATEASSATAGERVPLEFTPAQAAALQQIAAGLALDLPATPILSGPGQGTWITAPAERAEAVAAAVSILRTHQRLRSR